jgi:hypothetical protein
VANNAWREIMMAAVVVARIQFAFAVDIKDTAVRKITNQLCGCYLSIPATTAPFVLIVVD